MMFNAKDFEFLNSDIWLKYTQERYIPLDDLRYRLESLGYKRSDWEELKNTIQKHRKLASIPLFVDSIGKKFWFFPSDAIQKKINEIEHTGNKLYETIESKSKFKDEFLKDAKIEEAITSAIYEGANSTRAKAKQLITSQKSPKSKDEWMIVNNYEAMKWIKENSDKKISTDLIKEIHLIVTKNTLEGDDAAFSGKFRNDVVYVGDHTGIEHEKIIPTLNEIINLCVNNKRYQHGLIKGILLHYFVAYVHPFFDGNGRTARTLFYFKSIKNDLKFVELLSISAHLKNNGNRYEKAFHDVVANDYDVTYFVDFCLESLLAALNKIDKKITYLFKIAKIKEKHSLSNSQVLLLQRLALNKFINISSEEYAQDLGRTREMGRRELKDLFTKKFLKERKEGKKLVYSIDPAYLRSVVPMD
ncbi:MAG: Fic family protein [Proteobacteria bacterium]|nr:Fic family protein [Pseudomonadota bacterium]